MTPYEVTHGKLPPSIPQYITGTSSVEGVDSLLASHQDMFQILKKLECVQEHMKKDTNVHRMDVVFAISDWVYVKLCPHRQTSLSGTSYQKMGKWYYGPYQITEFIDSIAYKLALPKSGKIHPVFHSSLLKPHHGPLQSEQPLPPTALEGKLIIHPLSILDHKWDSSNPPKLLVLVQWLGLQLEDSTWEDWDK